MSNLLENPHLVLPAVKAISILVFGVLGTIGLVKLAEWMENR